ncbi:MAG: hypothetical protein IPN17_32340 [Deltaproteobacteria bacterium]|nr:hypothetical protein [Deltaproteobacteria bacterium]
MHRPHRLAVVALLLAGCSSGAVVGSDAGTTTTPPDNLDDWGGDRGSMMQSPGTGDFGIGEMSTDPPEMEPSEGDAPTEPESPPEEDPTVDVPDEDGVTPRDPDEGADPDSRSGIDPPVMGASTEVPLAEPLSDNDPGGADPMAVSDPPYQTAVPTVQRRWFRTPAGSPIFLNGVNTVYGGSFSPRIGPYLAAHAPAEEWRRMSSRSTYGLNWIGSWIAHDNPVIATANAPYGAVLSASPAAQLRQRGDASAPASVRSDGQPFSPRGHWLQDPRLPGGRTMFCGGISRRTFGDPFNPDYQREVAAQLETQVARHRHRRNLVLYYMGNEQGLGDYTRERSPTGATPDPAYCARGTGIADLRRFVWTECPNISSIDLPLCAPHALASFLRFRYADIAALNAAWGASYASFDALLADRPQPTAGARGDDLADFALTLVRQYVRVTTEAIRRADTQENGMVLRPRARPIASPRLAIATDRGFHFYSLGGTADRWTTGGEVPDPHPRRTAGAHRPQRQPRARSEHGALRPVPRLRPLPVAARRGLRHHRGQRLHRGRALPRALAPHGLRPASLGLRPPADGERVRPPAARRLLDQLGRRDLLRRRLRPLDRGRPPRRRARAPLREPGAAAHPGGRARRELAPLARR